MLNAPEAPAYSKDRLQSLGPINKTGRQEAEQPVTVCQWDRTEESEREAKR